jgi:hypothetical protein
MKYVAGIFDSRMEAEQALAELLNAGVERDKISLIMTDQTKGKLFSSTDDEGTRAAKGAAAGAAIGGALGALVAGLTAVGSIVVPGAGLLAAGPIVAALSGAGAGAAVGGLSGALVRAGIAAAEANRYEEEVKAGKAVVIVHPANDNEALTSHDIMRAHHALTEAA